MTRVPYSGRHELELLEQATNYNRRLVDVICAVDTGNKHAVDFGAGMGTLAVGVARRGFDVTCVEPDPALRATLESRGLRVVDGIESLQDESVSYIYSVNVLEHIEGDAETLAQLYRKLQPGGHLLLYVPAFPILYSEMDEKVGHVRRYTRVHLARLVENSGFQLERVSYADSVGFFVSLAFRWLGSRGLSAGSIRFYDRFVFPVSRTLDTLGMSRLLGKNLVLVGRRRDAKSPAEVHSGAAAEPRRNR